jgi:preprotein translocase subunit SecG
MSTLILGTLAGTLLGWLMGFLSVFLILLVLVQRGRGGGLTGALGGPGGQSAFGSKAGDTFTIITIVVASIWGFTCAFTMWLLGTHAPSTTMPTTMKAGPSESEEDETKGIVIPKPGGSAFGEAGLSGIGDGGNTTTETPSMELTPADKKPTADKPAGETSDSGTTTESQPDGDTATSAESKPAESTPAEASSSPVESPKPDGPDSAAAEQGSSAETGDN